MSETRACVRFEFLDRGSFARVVLDGPPGNVLDAALVSGLGEALRKCAAEDRLKGVLLTAEGANFSYGSSIEEHRAEQAAGMLSRFHGLFRDLMDLSLPVVTAVRGRCLGGGLELAAWSHRVFVSPDADLGQPEIRLGVFAPVASLVLPRRIGQAAADDLLLSGRRVDAAEAHRLGLADQVAEDPELTALEYLRTSFGESSAAAIKQAVAAARWQADRDFRAGIEALEQRYLAELMVLEDPHEGIAAFLEKRVPHWRHR